MWPGFSFAMAVFVLRWIVRARFLFSFMNIVPGPRRVVQSFQSGGLVLDVIIWAFLGWA